MGGMALPSTHPRHPDHSRSSGPGSQATGLRHWGGEGGKDPLLHWHCLCICFCFLLTPYPRKISFSHFADNYPRLCSTNNEQQRKARIHRGFGPVFFRRHPWPGVPSFKRKNSRVIILYFCIAANRVPHSPPSRWTVGNFAGVVAMTGPNCALPLSFCIRFRLQFRLRPRFRFPLQGHAQIRFRENQRYVCAWFR